MLPLTIACVLSGFLVSLAATALMRRLAPMVGLMDKPNPRKVHAMPTPLGGGIGIWLGVTLPLAAAAVLAAALSALAARPTWVPAELMRHLEGVVHRAPQLWWVLGCGTALVVVGIIDDRINLKWQPKLFVQVVVAALLVAGGVRATVFADAPWVGWAATIAWIVVLTNAFNFLDNMDGLSGGIGLIACGFFAVIMLTGTSQPRWFVAGVLLVLAGAIAGFLVHNWPPARIFMGDAGSCFLGMMLAAFTVLGTFYQHGQSAGRHLMLAPVCVLAVPLYDFASVVAIRLSQGRSPFHADKWHFSHRLVQIGMSRTRAVLTIHLLTFTTGLAGLLLYQVPGWTGAWLVLAVVLCLLSLIGILERTALLRNGDSSTSREGPGTP